MAQLIPGAYETARQAGLLRLRALLMGGYAACGEAKDDSEAFWSAAKSVAGTDGKAKLDDVVKKMVKHA